MPAPSLETIMENQLQERPAATLIGIALELKARKMHEIAKEVLSEIPTSYDPPSMIFFEGFSLRDEVHKYELSLIQLALKLTNGNQKRAAALLGINYTTLHSKVRNLLTKSNRTGRNRAK